MKIKNLISSINNKLSSSFKKNKKFWYLGFVLVVLICLSIFVFPNSINSKSDEDLTNQQSSVCVQKYEYEIEQKIKQMLLSISEISDANVMVVCDATERVEYLKNISETTSGSGDNISKTTTEEVVFEKNGSNSSAIVVSKINPKIVGVWIVINEVSPSTKLSIINSICSVLNINESSISILQGR